MMHTFHFLNEKEFEMKIVAAHTGLPAAAAIGNFEIIEGAFADPSDI